MTLTLRKKIIGSFLIVAILSGIIGVISVYYNHKLDGSYSNITNRASVILNNATRMEYLSEHEVSLLREHFATNAPDDQKGIHSTAQQLSQLVKKTLLLNPTKTSVTKLNKLATMNQKFVAESDNVFQMSNSKSALQYTIKNNLFEYGVNMRNVAASVAKTTQANLSHAKLVNHQISRKTNIVVISLTIVLFLIAIAAGVITSTLITTPLLALMRETEIMAAGDLTRDDVMIKSKDEVGSLAQAFNRMKNNLRSIIQSVSESSQQVAASAEELSASSDETSKATEQIAATIQQAADGTQKQSLNLEEGKQSILEMTNGIQHIAENTNNVAISAEDANRKSVTGNEAIQTAVQQMSSIQNTVTDLSSVVQQLGSKSQVIGEITDAITSIASQTNLLALNAAIEAARAGESGRGFAVVADEVRKLAEESSKSAEQIAALIRQIQDGTSQAVSVTAATASQVSHGLKAVNQAGVSFEDIGFAVSSVSEQIQNVSAATQQLSAGAVQLNDAVSEIAQISEVTASGMQTASASTEEQLAAAEEIGASASSLRDMAEQLQELIGQFRI
ncbi:methyl-accepting chemotaxis protein [Alicyclobacillus sp. SO9]|uniref:methyl-accepting chemotaxis protein n=1 Tax=Alicyclobacillus sp. SO9 TaxID=2665646 RepID=UPI0018E78567|nr:methyl-accepting chemotaxis protein [Alicyclobacillus sp. SO9]QQE79757.1 HAMP domain-containing protein [Alicyclobacillus sp. SO9]